MLKVRETSQCGNPLSSVAGAWNARVKARETCRALLGWPSNIVLGV